HGWSRPVSEKPSALESACSPNSSRGALVQSVETRRGEDAGGLCVISVHGRRTSVLEPVVRAIFVKMVQLRLGPRWGVLRRFERDEIYHVGAEALRVM